MNLPDLSYIRIDPIDLENIKIMLWGAVGCASVLFLLSAWNRWGSPRWERRMDSRKRERDQLTLMVDHQIGALEYMVKDQLMSPQDMWKLAPKFDSIPGFRDKLRDMLKKYLPQAQEVPKSKLAELSLQP